MKFCQFITVLVMGAATYINANCQEAGSWIAVPEDDGQQFSVCYFRKDFQVDRKPESMRVRVSGDNRYKLYVNRTLVDLGPSRSDLEHWNYNVLDLAPYIDEGHNVIVAKVINEGPKRPVAGMTWRTGFMLQSDEAATDFLASGDSWLCRKDASFSPLLTKVKGYYAAGPGEAVDLRMSISDWNETDFEPEGWLKPVIVSRINDRENRRPCGDFPGWRMKPNDLPQMELHAQRFQSISQMDGATEKGHFLSGGGAVSIPAHSRATMLIDNKELTNAYPSIVFSGGKDASITLSYAEALYGEGWRKGNRDETEGKFFVGRRDSLISAGTARQSFTPMTWRTYRYVKVSVLTSDEPLEINDIYGTFIGFPFKLAAEVETADKDMERIMSIGWHTARMCAIETYMDCPYYEQLQYFGDSRIQALVSMYMTGDDRLVRKCLDMADWSRKADGVTQSRYPASLAQWIQPYALHYIYALHDYMMYGNDMEFVRSKLMSTRTVLDYFSRYQCKDGRLPYLPGWNFSDWVEGWDNGIAPAGEDGCSAILDLQLLYAYQMAADLEKELGMDAYAALYCERIELLKSSIQDRYWRASTGLYSDHSDGELYSEHAQALAILTGMVSGEKALHIAKALEHSTLQNDMASGASSDGIRMTPASIYFKFYTNQAMAAAGLADNYLDWLGVWRRYMGAGMSTWGEMSDIDKTRSDCHAWGSSPNIEIMRTVLGIDSRSPAFRTVRIEPHLGRITSVGGSMPHPDGEIKVKYGMKRNSLHAEITLPQGISGTFVWKGQECALHGGLNRLIL